MESSRKNIRRDLLREEENHIKLQRSLVDLQKALKAAQGSNSSVERQFRSSNEQMSLAAESPRRRIHDLRSQIMRMEKMIEQSLLHQEQLRQQLKSI